MIGSLRLRLPPVTSSGSPDPAAIESDAGSLDQGPGAKARASEAEMAWVMSSGTELGQPGATEKSTPAEPVLCGHCGRTASNGISCIGACVADSGY